MSEHKIKFIKDLPNGFGLFVKDDTVGGRIYFTDENSVEAIVWETSIISESTILAALVEEAYYRFAMKHK